MAPTTVADVLADGLVRAGVRRIFAAAGGPTALADAARRRSLAIVEAPDAMSASVLAAVTGEVSDAPGAALAGFADTPALVRGLAHAQRDRAPMIVVTPVREDGGLLAPVVKASVIVEAASAAHWIAHASQLSMSDPRGPVHLVLADEVAGAAALPVATSCRAAPLPPPDPASLESLAAALAAAVRPLLITGLECGADDARWIRSFAETLPAPVLATRKGKGALADPHPLALGALAADHAALARADLVILVGVDAGELPPGTLSPTVRVARIGRALWPDGGFLVDVRGDIALVIEELAPHVRARPAADWDVAELDRIKRAVTRAATSTPAGRLIALAREATPAGTLATSEAEPLVAWSAVGPREGLTPLGAAPGYGLLAAFALQLEFPERRVVVFTRAAGLAAGEWVLLRAGEAGRERPIVVVVLGEVEPERRGRIERGRVELLRCRGESEFARDFSRAFLAGVPALVVSLPEATPTPGS